MKDNPQILGLALGGGAFRGRRISGVLKALEEEGLLLPQDFCVAPVRAMVAAFYAFGMPPEEIRKNCP